jgi:hypothetical protein
MEVMEVNDFANLQNCWLAHHSQTLVKPHFVMMWPHPIG